MHGLFGSSDNWMTLGRQFSARFKVTIVDLRNHGRSPGSDLWSYDVMADDVFQLSQRLGVDSIYLLGHSMGGKIGMTLADKYPDLIKKLIVADIAPKYYPVRHRHIIDGLVSIDLKRIENRKEADAQLSKYVPEVGIRMFLLKNLTKDRGGAYTWKLNLKVINDHLENVGTATIPAKKITVPTMFIRGVNSDYITDGDILEIRKHYENSRVESIGNAGHWLHAEQPKAFMETVFDFLDG